MAGASHRESLRRLHWDVGSGCDHGRFIAGAPAACCDEVTNRNGVCWFFLNLRLGKVGKSTAALCCDNLWLLHPQVAGTLADLTKLLDQHPPCQSFRPLEVGAPKSTTC